MLQVVGPTRYYCLAADCTVHVDDDQQAFCDEHWLQEHIYKVYVKTRNDMDEHAWIRMKKQNREVEAKTAATQFTQTTTGSTRNNSMTCPFNVLITDGTDELIIHWEDANGQTYQQRIFRPSN